jgi:hypothetical protein
VGVDSLSDGKRALPAGVTGSLLPFSGSSEVSILVVTFVPSVGAVSVVLVAASAAVASVAAAVAAAVVSTVAASGAGVSTLATSGVSTFSETGSTITISASGSPSG